MVIIISENLKKTEDMNRYEKETGKKSIWRGVITEGFKKWKKGEKIYEQNKERITILITEETKENWQKYIEYENIKTISSLIRKAVKFYIESQPKLEFLKTFSVLSHDLKEPLTSIKGFTQILLEDYSNQLDLDGLIKLKEIYSQSTYLEKTINEAFKQIDFEGPTEPYDILIVEDDFATLAVLENFFERRNYKCKGKRTGKDTLIELNKNMPKLVLLDILLPDISGYEICKKVKLDKKLKNVPVYYITAIPEAEVMREMEETGADGYFLKPFNFSEFEILYSYL